MSKTIARASLRTSPPKSSWIRRANATESTSPTSGNSKSPNLAMFCRFCRSISALQAFYKHVMALYRAPSVRLPHRRQYVGNMLFVPPIGRFLVAQSRFCGSPSPPISNALDWPVTHPSPPMSIRVCLMIQYLGYDCTELGPSRPLPSITHPSDLTRGCSTTWYVNMKVGGR